MPKIKKPLHVRLEAVAEDIQIGGDINFRAMGVAVVLGKASKTLTTEQEKDMERLLSRANRLLRDLCDFWEKYPDLDTIADRGEVACSDGLSAAERKKPK